MMRFFSSLLILSLLFTAACEQRKPRNEFRVALLTTGSVGDGGWNSTAYQGLKQIEAKLGAHTSNVETKSPAEFEESFRDYAARGYQLILGHGFEFQEAAMRVAHQFPDTTFLITSGAEAKGNVVPVIFGFGEATYVAGMAAAAASKTGKLGAIGGQPFPPVKDGFEAFERGAKAINPEATLVVSYVGNWEDAAAAKEAAKAQLHTGVDVLIQNADAAGMGVFQAVRETPGAYAVGTNSNQNDVMPDRILGSAVNDVAAAFLYVAERVKQGSPPRGVLRLGMKEGVVRYEENPRLAEITAAASSQIEAARARFAEANAASPVTTPSP